MIKLNGTFSISELKEILSLAEIQETTDRFTDTQLHINGEHAEINADIDENSDITIIKEV